MTSTSLAPYISPEAAELAGWIEHQIADGATRLALRQKSDESGDQLVRDFPVPGPNCARELADVVWRRAQDDGRHLRGRTLYGLFAYRDRDHLDRMFFTVQGVDDLSFGARDASLGAVTTQLMRHNEANARLAIGQTLDVIGHYKALLVAREKRIEELEEKYLEVMKLYEQLTTMKHQRDLELMAAAKADKQQDYLKEKVDMLLPLIASKMTGGAGAAKSILGEELLKQFLGSLTPKQMHGLLGMLTPEQGAVINEIYLAYGEREVAKKKNGKTTNGTNGVHTPSGGNGKSAP